MNFSENSGQETSENFKIPKPVSGYFIKGVAVLIVIILSYYSGYQTGHKGFVFVPKSFQVVNQNNAPANVDYNLLWDAIKTVNEKYIDKPIDQQKVLYGAVKGAVEASGDPYTTFFPPQELESFKTSLQGSFGGIGAEVGKQDGNIVIVAPLDDTPAKKAGILAKDIIAEVNGQSTQDWSVDEAVSKIRGPKGTAVDLTIVRPGENKALHFKIVRDVIVIKSVKLDYKNVTINGQNKTVAVITLTEFGDNTKSLFNQAVNDVLTKNVAGVIVDLRNNPGGYLQTSVDVASNWVKEGDLVVSEAHSDRTSITYKAEGNPRLSGLKTIVIMNGGTASAAEILSGALHDHGLAKLLGEKSFGKGSVQELVNLDEGGAVKVTIAKWITPNGVNLNHNGLDPDIEVKMTMDDIAGGKDPQMDKAIEEVTK